MRVRARLTEAEVQHVVDTLEERVREARAERDETRRKLSVAQGALMDVRDYSREFRAREIARNALDVLGVKVTYDGAGGDVP